MTERRDAGGRQPLDPGAYIGSEPELATETVPGGVGPAEDRISAYDSQGAGAGRPDARGQDVDALDERASDVPGVAGQNR